jgi:hypothetical protein
MTLARENQRMLGYYVRLVDYMAKETLVNIVENCMAKFYGEMLVERKTRLFQTIVNYSSVGIVFNPPEEEFHETIRNILRNMIGDIDSVNPVIWNTGFEPYISSEQLTSFPNCKEMLKNSESMRYYKENIRTKITMDFEEA